MKIILVADPGFIPWHAADIADSRFSGKIAQMHIQYFTKIPTLYPFDHFNVWGGVPDLEADYYT